MPEDRAAALASLIEEARRDPIGGGRAPSGPGERGALRGVLRRGGADDRLRREADREQGRAGPVRRAARPRRARRRSSASATTASELEALAPERVLFTGALEHRHLVHLLPLADVSVVPSIFPEAFGMVAAEAASAGVPPLVADHSGLAEVAAGIAAEYPAASRRADVVPERRRRRAPRTATRAARAAERRAQRARPRGAPRRRAQLELGARRRAAARATSAGLGFRRWATSRRSATRSCWPPPRPRSQRFRTSRSRWKRSSPCSTPRRSASSTASRTCSRRRPAPISSRISPAS